MAEKSFDVVVIGGGAAGLSGALLLARSRRAVLLVDAGEPRNAPADHAHNVLTRDGTSPREIYEIGREEVLRYGGRIEAGRVTAVRRSEDPLARFAVEFDGKSVLARRILVATGLRDQLPDIPGVAERWGKDVLHCAYCHGWEVRDQRIGVLGTGPLSVHQALLFRQLSKTVTFFQHTLSELTDEQRLQLDALEIPVVIGPVSRLSIEGDRLTGVVVGNETTSVDAAVVAPMFAANAGFLAPLGLVPADFSAGEAVIGSRIEAGPGGATKVPGVWVAGNVGNLQAQVSTAASEGIVAGAAINADLVTEDATRAAEALRYERVYGAQALDDRCSEHGHRWSGKPNPTLVQEVAGLNPGRALDVGAGEGGDALWLAEQGWTVTGVELSGVALERAAQRAKAADLPITWLQADVTREAVPGSYDMVCAHYVPIGRKLQPQLWERLAAAVAPGGRLLVVGHDFSDLQTTMPRPQLQDMGWTADEVAASLEGDWTIEVCEARPRDAVDPEGQPVKIADAVLRARRSERRNESR